MPTISEPIVIIRELLWPRAYGWTPHQNFYQQPFLLPWLQPWLLLIKRQSMAMLKVVFILLRTSFATASVCIDKSFDFPFLSLIIRVIFFRCYSLTMSFNFNPAWSAPTAALLCACLLFCVFCFENLFLFLYMSGPIYPTKHFVNIFCSKIVVIFIFFC